MNKAYIRINWENYPSLQTPLNEENLNKMDSSVDEIDNRVISLDTTKFNKTEAQNLIKGLTFNPNNGVFTITYYNGSTATIDTLLEKLAVNFDFDETTQRMVIYLSDGTEKYVDLSAFLTPLEFIDSDTIDFQLSDNNSKVTAIVKEGSIQEKHLQPNYLAKIKVESAKAESAATNTDTYAKQSQSYAVGTDGAVRPEDSTDNAKYYYEQTRDISQGLSGALIPMGTIAFSSLPALSDVESGWMYNISDQFTTTSDFKEGAGHVIPFGSNVYKTADGKWDVLAGTPVASVNGETGDVTVTPESIGASTFGGIIGWIVDGKTSSSLEQYGISKDDTVFDVFRKLPPFSFTIINSNAQINAYASSLPHTNAKGCTLLFKDYGTRGWMEFFPYDIPGNVCCAKVLDNQIGSWQKTLSDINVMVTEEQLNANIDVFNVAGASLVKEMFKNVFSKVRISNITISPRWGHTIETEYCELIGNIIHAKFQINKLYLTGNQWMATIECVVQRQSVTIGEAVAYVPSTEAFYPLAVFPAEGAEIGGTGRLTIGYLEGMPVYTPPNSNAFENAIIVAKITVNPV